ncbi:pyrroline-5-carboxylate reductase [Chloroflexota bacterium]
MRRNIKGRPSNLIVTFIGGGNMGEAILSALLQKGLSLPQTISVSDINELRLKYLQEKYGVAVVNDNIRAIEKGEIIILAIKPQNLNETMAELNGRLKSSQVMLSIIAGVKIETLRRGLGHQSVVRAMPNTPAQIGEGITVWTATDEVTNQQKKLASSIFGAIGKDIYVENEDHIDMATAISGSGPAYFFLFLEALIKAATEIGLPRKTGEKLALETMIGSGRLLQQSGKKPKELRRLVTSPGGTTAEALLQFEKGNFDSLVRQAVRAAYNKAKSLGAKQ